VAALHAAQTKRRRLVEQIAHWDPEEPEMATLLRRIEQEDQSQQPVYERSSCAATPIDRLTQPPGRRPAKRLPVERPVDLPCAVGARTQ